MFCTKCGEEVKDGSNFCTKCGNPIEQIPINQEPQNTTTQGAGEVSGTGQSAGASQSTGEAQNAGAGQSAGPDQVASAGLTQGAGQVQNPNPTNTKQGQKKTAIIIAGIVAAVIAIALIIILIVSCSGNNNQGGPTIITSANKGQETQLSIAQIDTSKFPELLIYANIVDKDGKKISDIKASDIQLIEYKNSDELTSLCSSLEAISDSDTLSINLVLDKSGSMNSSNKMRSATNAAKTFIDEFTKKDNSELEITAFDDKVYNKQPFTNNTELLYSSLNALTPSGETALYDALYWSLQRTSLKSGNRCVVAFTDGEENDSTYTEKEVIELSNKTGTPVYIIGIGSSINKSSLESLASKCKGSYYSCADGSDMADALAKIYSSIYNYTVNLFKLGFTSQLDDSLYSVYSVKLCCVDGSKYSGSCKAEYSPKNDISLYDNKAVNGDYILPDSNSRYYSESELSSMSLWDLYLARNEIYARHGRDFKNKDLQEYFKTKSWYSIKYTPEEFNAIEDTVFNDYEKKNALAMLEIEKSRNSPYLVTAK
ncbi:MAG: YARHG domain-containing protein [Coriobacteriales bacterium]|nr:YARHG domain-containing protein [Coriobacteriales bacterium]